MIKDEVYAFIDSQNLNLGVRSQGWKLDFKKFRIYLADKYKVKKAYLFIGFIPGNQNLYDYLKNCGYKLVFKQSVEIRKGGKLEVKGNVDAELVLHAMIQFKNYNKAIIVSGDGDFRCLVEYLLKKRRLGRLLIPNRKKYSRLLYEFIDNIDFVSNLKVKLREIKRGASLLRTKP